MLISNGDGTFSGGPLDVIFLYHNVVTDTYHPVLYVESPFPGVRERTEDLKTIRLKSRMSHTTGAPTFEEGLQLLNEMRQQISVPDENVFIEQAMPWSGEVGDVMVVGNWRKPGAEHQFNPGISV